MTDIAALLERVEKATGHDDALNVSLYARFAEGFPIAEEIARLRIVPDYTGSIDAALALVEKVRPEVKLDIRFYPESVRVTLERFDLMPYVASDYDAPWASAPTAPLAIIAALLKSYGGHDNDLLTDARGVSGERANWSWDQKSKDHAP